MKTIEEWIIAYNTSPHQFSRLADLLHVVRDEALDAAAEASRATAALFRVAQTGLTALDDASVEHAAICGGACEACAEAILKMKELP